MVTPLTPQPDTSLSGDASYIAGQWLSLAERQVDDIADNGAMRRVVKSEGAFSADDCSCPERRPRRRPAPANQ